MKRIQNIQALRGIAVTSVVFIHLIMMEQKYGGYQTLLAGPLKFRFYGVDLFFVMSGFLMVTITRGKFQDSLKALKFLYGRITRIYPIYWIFTSFVLMIYLVQPGWVNNYQGNQVNILSSYLLIPEQTLPLVIVAWTLIHEIYFYTVFTVVILFVKEEYLKHSLLLWGLITIVINLFIGPVTPVIKIISHPLTLEFISGCLLAYTYYNSEIIIRERILIIIAVFCVVSALTGYYIYQLLTNEIEMSGWWRILIFGIPAFFTVFSMIYAEKQGVVLHKMFINIGNASYSIYLTHIMTLSAFGRIWSMFASDGFIDNIFMLPLSFIVTVLVGFISYEYLEKPLMNLSKRLV